nr:probable BOI-related E3 ubiquitin-protein ligase 3 [Ipomoea batatas]
MAVEANSNLLPQEFSDFIPLGMENCRDFMSTKPRLAAYQRIFPFNRSRPVKNVVAGNSLQQPSLHGKRSRDSLDLYSHPSTQIGGGGDDFLQSEIDRIVAHHTKKLRIEFEERQKLPSRNSMAAIGEGLVKKLREKDEEIQRMGKLNLALQERCEEFCTLRISYGEIWRTSPTSACPSPPAVAAVEEDAESCCREQPDQRPWRAGDISGSSIQNYTNSKEGNRRASGDFVQPNVQIRRDGYEERVVPNSFEDSFLMGPYGLRRNYKLVVYPSHEVGCFPEDSSVLREVHADLSLDV